MKRRAPKVHGTGRRIRTALLAASIFTLGVAGRANSQTAGTPPPDTLSLPQAVALALEQSPTIAESRENSDAARQAKKEAWLNRLPTIEVREIGVRTNSPADVFGLQLMQERFSFPEFTAKDPNDPDPLNNFTTQFEAAMPIFTGGQLSNGIRQAGRMADAAEAMREHTIAAVELGVADAYLNALLAERFVELAARARDTALKHVEKAHDFYDAGMILESDLLQAQVQLSRMEEDLMKARNGASLALAGLNRAIGIGQDRPFQLIETASPPDSLTPSLDAALGMARTTRRDLLAVTRKVQAAEAGIGRARGEYWPQVGISARYALNDDKLFGTNGDSYTLAAVAQWKALNWGQTRARVTRSQSEHRAAQASQRSYEQQVEFEVRQAWLGLQEARASHAARVSAVRAADRASSILGDRFEQGLAKVTDLLDAETLADEARVREAQSSTDLQRAVRTLRFAIGLPPTPEVVR
jgi:outer membrane protein